jgi:hypothetical protein
MNLAKFSLRRSSKSSSTIKSGKIVRSDTNMTEFESRCLQLCEFLINYQFVYLQKKMIDNPYKFIHVTNFYWLSDKLSTILSNHIP